MVDAGLCGAEWASLRPWRQKGVSQEMLPFWMHAFTSIYGLDLKPQIVLEGLGKEFQIGKVNLKPYCSARQAVASDRGISVALADTPD